MLTSRAFGISSTVASPSSSRPCLTQILRPSLPCPPPSRPYGARVRRYEDGLDVTKPIEQSQVPQRELILATVPRIQVHGSHPRLRKIFQPQQSPRANQRYARARGIVAQVSRHRQYVYSLYACGPLTFHANLGLLPNLPRLSTWSISICTEKDTPAATCLVITPSCDCATLTIFTTGAERKIVRAPLTGGASMECSQHNIYDAL